MVMEWAVNMCEVWFRILLLIQLQLLKLRASMGYWRFDGLSSRINAGFSRIAEWPRIISGMLPAKSPCVFWTQFDHEFCLFLGWVPKTDQQHAHHNGRLLHCQRHALLFITCSRSFISKFWPQNPRREPLSCFGDVTKFPGGLINNNFSKTWKQKNHQLKVSGMALVGVVCRKFIPKSVFNLDPSKPWSHSNDRSVFPSMACRYETEGNKKGTKVERQNGDVDIGIWCQGMNHASTLSSSASSNIESGLD